MLGHFTTLCMKGLTIQKNVIETIKNPVGEIE